jgi:peptide methionine sulfoxide reductase MsrA
MGDHTESIEIDFDSSKISFNDLITIFWENDHSEYPSWSRQYKPIIFYHNDLQKRLAIESDVSERCRVRLDY